ncbi:MAG: lipid-A-disaccharide synthase, partial [Steroidobacteraceae bacterium]|nr:lipid-A-disaccharide synthase [Steroidobacteraceae bacterium]
MPSRSSRSAYLSSRSSSPSWISSANRLAVSSVEESRLRIALVAGETSGDTLGAALIDALKRRFPDAQFAGVAGPRMKAAGCVAWHGIEELSVMGLTEVISHLPKLLRLRGELVRRLTQEWRPDVFIGVDYKEFNLGLAR